LAKDRFPWNQPQGRISTKQTPAPDFALLFGLAGEWQEAKRS
jgi:hypothetical protein